MINFTVLFNPLNVMKYVLLLFFAALSLSAVAQQPTKTLYFNSDYLKNESDSISIYCMECKQTGAELQERYQYLSGIQGPKPLFEKTLDITVDAKDTLGMDTALKVRYIVTGYVYIDADGYVRKVLAKGSNAASRLSFITKVALPYKYKANPSIKQTRVKELKKVLRERYIKMEGVLMHQYYWDDYKEDTPY